MKFLKYVYIIALFNITSILFAQSIDNIANKKWIILPQQISEDVIRKYNDFISKENDSIDIINRPEDLQTDRPLIITAKEKRSGSNLKYDILSVDYMKSDEVTVNIINYKDNIKNPMGILGTQLSELVSKKNYYWKELKENVVEDQLITPGRLRDVYWWTPGRYEISLYQMVARITDNWGAEFRIGDDELGYPFWTSGTFKLGLNHQSLKIFLQAPIGIGKSNSLSLGNRMLEGGLGGGISFDMNDFGGRVSFSEITKMNDQFANDSSSFYIPFAGQFYYTSTYPIDLDYFSGSLRIKLGLGYHQVLNILADKNNIERRITNGKRDNLISPFIRFDYILKNKKVESFLQFYNLSLLVGASYNITDWLGIEAKFSSWNVMRGLYPKDSQQKYENSSFFVISPRIRF